MKRTSRHRRSGHQWLRGRQRIAAAVLALAVAGTLAAAPMAAFATDTGSGGDIVAMEATASAAALDAAPGTAELSSEAANQPQLADATPAVPPPTQPQAGEELPAPGPDPAGAAPAGTDAGRAPPEGPSPGEDPSALAPGTAAAQGAATSTATATASEPEAPQGPVAPRTAPGGGLVATPAAAAAGCGSPTLTATLKGRIVGAGSGEPVAGFKVGTPCAGLVTTDQDGRFSIAVPAGDFNYLNATGNDAGGYEDMHLTDNGLVLDSSQDPSPWRQLKTTEGSTLDLGNLTLPASASGVFSGEITAPAGLSTTVINRMMLTDAKGNNFAAAATIVPGASGTWSKAVPAGDYKIQLSTGDPFETLWWKTATSAADALSVHISAGQRITGINAAPRMSPAIAGTVTDAAGAPVKNASVQVFRVGGPSWSQAQSNTDAQGKYVLTGLDRNVAYLVQFSSDQGMTQYYNNAYKVAQAQPVTITESSATGIDARLQPGASISGSIVDVAGNKIAGADGRVELQNVEDGNSPSGNAYVDAGSYSFKNVPQGEYVLAYIPNNGTTSYHGNTTQISKATHIVVGSNDTQARTGKDIATGVGGSISGTVGVPVGMSPAGTVAKLFRADDLNATVQSVNVGADGKFTFSALATNNYAVAIDSGNTLYVQRWFGNDGTRQNATAISIDDETTFNAVNVALHTGGIISGTLTRTDTAGRWDSVLMSDSQGGILYDSVDSIQWEPGELTRNWQSRVLEAGSYAVQLSGDGVSTWWENATDFEGATKITLAAGQRVTGIDMLRPATASTVSGRLVAPAGQSVQWATVSLTPVDAMYGVAYGDFNDDGTFSVSTGSTGDFKLKAVGTLTNGLPFTSWLGDTAAFTQARVLSLPAQGTVIADLTIAVQPVHAYSVTVLSAVTGRPVPDAAVTLFSVDVEGDYAFSNSKGVATGASGVTGEHSYSVRADGFQTSRGTVNITAAGPNELAVQLSPAAALTGTVTSANNGVPLDGVSVGLRNADGDYLDTVYTQNGKYSFPNLAPGKYKLAFENYSGLYVAQWYKDAVDVQTATLVTVGPEGAVADAALDLGGIVTGTIVDAQGNPVPFAQVGLAKKAGAGIMGLQNRSTAFVLDPSPGEILGIVTQTDQNGNYRLPPLAAGEYALYIYSPFTQTTWYNGKSTLAEADTFFVATGQTSVISTAALPLQDGAEPRLPEETLSNAFQVTRQPQNTTAAVGEQASFQAAASGEPRPTVQWQCSADGAEWTAIDGETQGFLGVSPVTAESCTKYRAVFTQGATTLTSDVATLTVKQPAKAPSQPDAAVAGGISRTQATLTWTAPADNGAAITGYVVKLYDGGAEPVRSINAGNVTELAISGLLPETSYQATVTAVNAEGGSTPSNATSFTTKPVELPGTPENLVANTASTTSLSLAWSAPREDGGAPVNDYEVTIVQGATVVSGPTKTGGALFQSVSGLLPDTGYTVQVKALNSKGASTLAAIATVRTPKDTPVPTVPAAPAKPSAALSGTNAIYVSWVAPADGHSPIDGFTVTLQDVSLAVVSTKTVGASIREASFGELDPGRAYTAIVTAHNAIGDSAASLPSGTVEVPAQKPSAPGAATAKAATSSTLEVAWTAPAGDGGSAITGYTVTLAATESAQGKMSKTITTGAAERSVLFDGLDADTAYTVAVSACNAVGCTSGAPATMRTAVKVVDPGTGPTPTPKPSATPTPSATPGGDPAPTQGGKPVVSTSPTATATTAGTGTGTGTALPVTGAGSVGAVAAAALLLALAGGLLVAGRRRLGRTGSHRS